MSDADWFSIKPFYSLELADDKAGENKVKDSDGVSD
jgi:hypothetical protein